MFRQASKFLALLVVIGLGLWLSNQIGRPVSDGAKAECRAVASYAASKGRRHVQPVLRGAGQNAALDCISAFRAFNVDISEQSCEPNTACFEDEFVYRRARTDKHYPGVFTVEEGLFCGRECGYGTDITFIRIAGWWFAVKWQHTWIA